MNNAILTIVTLSVSGSVLALVLLALKPLLKNTFSKTFQYYIWLLVLIRLALPLSFDGSIMNRIAESTAAPPAPIVTFSDGRSEAAGQGQNVPQNLEQAPVYADMPSEGASQDPPVSTGVAAARFNLWAFAAEHLLEIWLLGACVYFGWFFIAYLRFSHKVRKTSVRPHPKDMAVFVRMRGHAKVRLACNPYIDTPMLIGFPAPCIVIPQLAFVENGMKPELQHILQHELTHYHRHDLLYKWFVAAVCSLHWFNPLMLLVRREINRSCELACDEAVIRRLRGEERQSYGETLLAIASGKRLPAGILATTMCEEKRALKERLESIMIYKNKSVAVVAVSLVLSLVLAGCSVALGAANVSSPPAEDGASQTPAATVNPDETAMPDETAEQPAVDTEAPEASLVPSGSVDDDSAGQVSADNPVSEAYKSVLQNKAEFYNTDNGKSQLLNDFLADNGVYSVALEASRFSVLDLDGDGVPEVVLELSVGDAPEFFEVLHYADGKVYGYLVVYRGLQDLKADGTFVYSSGAADSGWGRLAFTPDALRTVSQAYSQSSQDEAGMSISYFINDKPVIKETFDSLANEQYAKESAAWSEFTAQNISTALDGGGNA